MLEAPSSPTVVDKRNAAWTRQGSTKGIKVEKHDIFLSKITLPKSIFFKKIELYLALK